MNFIVDAETDGLYGTFLSIAVLVTDENGTEQDHFYGALRISADNLNSKWVKENVYPSLGNAERMYDTEQELLNAFWDCWMKYREKCICIADVPYPVEARLFMRCVMNNLTEREFLGPYPLFDLSSVLAAVGIDPDADRKELACLNLVRHDAMDDVRMTEAIWRKCATALKH